MDTRRKKTEAEIREEINAQYDARMARLAEMPEPTAKQIREMALCALAEKSMERLERGAAKFPASERALARNLYRMTRQWGPKRGGLPFRILCSYVRTWLEEQGRHLPVGEVGDFLVRDALIELERLGDVREERDVTYPGMGAGIRDDVFHLVRDVGVVRRRRGKPKRILTKLDQLILDTYEERGRMPLAEFVRLINDPSVTVKYVRTLLNTHRQQKKRELET